MKKVLALALALCLVFALAAVASADWAPNGPVSVIVSYKAGSGTASAGPSSLPLTRMGRPSALSTCLTSAAPS